MGPQADQMFCNVSYNLNMYIILEHIGSNNSTKLVRFRNKTFNNINNLNSSFIVSGPLTGLVDDTLTPYCSLNVSETPTLNNHTPLIIVEPFKL